MKGFTFGFAWGTIRNKGRSVGSLSFGFSYSKFLGVEATHGPKLGVKTELKYFKAQIANSFRILNCAMIAF